MKHDRMSPVDASRELIIDSILLTKDVLHSIHNKLPIPLDNVILQRIEASQEFVWERPEPSRRILLLNVALGLATVLIIAAL